MNIFDHYRQRYEAAKDEEFTLQEFLTTCRQDRSAYANAAERLLMAIGEPVMVDTAQEPRLSRLFSNRVIARYPAFEEFYGMEDAIEQIVSYLKHAAQGLEEKKQILYLLGPVGGGKSSLAERLKSLMQLVPIYVLSANGERSPVNDHPFCLFNPQEDAQILEKEYDMNSPEGKTAFHKEAAKRLTMFEEEIERNNYIEAVAEKYRIGYEELKKLVGKMAIQMGQATPAERPKQTANREKQKEDGNLKSQKILLTWLIENEALFAQIKKYIVPEDFTKELYRTVAEILYEQYEAGEVNPAKVMNHFTDEEEHREVAELFHTKIRELTTKEEQEKALKETIIRVKYNSIEFATKMLNPTDIVGLQRLMEAKKSLQDLQKMHISID